MKGKEFIIRTETSLQRIVLSNLKLITSRDKYKLYNKNVKNYKTKNNRKFLLTSLEWVLDQAFQDRLKE